MHHAVYVSTENDAPIIGAFFCLPARVSTAIATNFLPAMKTAISFEASYIVEIIVGRGANSLLNGAGICMLGGFANCKFGGGVLIAGRIGIDLPGNNCD